MTRRPPRQGRSCAVGVVTEERRHEQALKLPLGLDVVPSGSTIHLGHWPVSVLAVASSAATGDTTQDGGTLTPTTPETT